ncbi:TIGR04222 domain-containing membrane protein [Streptomyces sp. NBC_01255]|uniref:TIGR04222 domain-containing membrane protein n=1 Tax=Streptomyces sp. NBC_01255 TaxID=2903798 RepID=UPI002E33F5D7|nr:TIGR04222 domain-containing membrane protein [Streptomyces sp. NBC_01255]
MNTLVVVFYVAGAAGIALLVTRVVRSRGGSGGPVHDRYEAAFLNGGPARVVDTAIAALQYDGRIAIGGPGIVAVVRPVAHDPVERAVLQEHAAAPHGALHHLRLAAMRHPAVQEIGDGLAARGLIVEPARRSSTLGWCLALGLTAFFLFPVSVVLTVLDLATAQEMSVPFVVKVLPALFAAGVTAISCGAVASKRITSAGQAALAAYGRTHGHLADAGHLVALYGLRGLPDPVLREQLLAAARVYAPPRGRGRGRRPAAAHHSTADYAAGVAVAWCAENSFCGGGGSSPGGGSGSCSSGSCSSGSCSGGGSSCGGGGGGSSCSSSSGSSCSSSSSSGSSCSSSSS